MDLLPLSGRGDALGAARSDGDILRNIAGAQLDPDLFALILDPAAAQAFSESLAARWFGRGLQELGRIAAHSQADSHYERAIREGQVLYAGED